MTRSIKYENVFYEIFISDGVSRVAMDMRVMYDFPRGCDVAAILLETLTVIAFPVRAISNARMRQRGYVNFIMPSEQRFVCFLDKCANYFEYKSAADGHSNVPGN